MQLSLAVSKLRVNMEVVRSKQARLSLTGSLTARRQLMLAHSIRKHIVETLWIVLISVKMWYGVNNFKVYCVVG
ncbi:MAG: hypothetical protein O3B82_00375 [Bacteroidetes bacterium]|nr:hypothetical protein [Bacteroidota bacterium]